MKLLYPEYTNHVALGQLPLRLTMRLTVMLSLFIMVNVLAGCSFGRSSPTRTPFPTWTPTSAEPSAAAAPVAEVATEAPTVAVQLPTDTPEPAPPTSEPTPVPTDTPVPEEPPTAAPTDTPIPEPTATAAFAFTLEAAEKFPTTSLAANVVRVFLYVYSPTEYGLPGYTVQVLHNGAPLVVDEVTAAGAPEQTRTEPSPYTRFANMNVVFVEPQAGRWEVQLLDGARNPVGPAAAFDLTADESTRELYLRYRQE